MNLSLKTQNFNWKSTSSNLREQNEKQNCFQNKKRLQIWIVNSCADFDKDGENIPKLESVEVVLVNCNLVKNDYQHTSKVLFTFFQKKQFEQLVNILPHFLTMMNTVNTEFLFAEVCFIDQVSKALEIEKNVNLTQIIGWHYKNKIEPKYRKYVKGYRFLSFTRTFGDKYGKKLMDTARLE